MSALPLKADIAVRHRDNPDGVGPSLDLETMASEPGSVPAWTGNSMIDRIVALTSEAIRHANKG
jgi:hypothetical protein